MRTLLQIMLIGAVSLILGIFVNQMNPGGIPARLLFGVSPFSDDAKDIEVTADSAFVFLIQDNVRFVDIRPVEMYEQEHLPEAISIPFNSFFRQEIPISKTSPGTIILYGEKEDSLNVRLCTQYFQKKYPNALMLKDGLQGWFEYGFPTEGNMP